MMQERERASVANGSILFVSVEHEIKHDGFRVIARKDGNRMRLYSRPGNDLTYRFPLIVESLAKLRGHQMHVTCLLGGHGTCSVQRVCLGR